MNVRKLYESLNHRFSDLCTDILSVLESEYDMDDELVIATIMDYINEHEKRMRSLRQTAEKMFADIVEKGLIEESQVYLDICEGLFLIDSNMYKILHRKACKCKSKKDFCILIADILQKKQAVSQIIDVAIKETKKP